MHDNSNKVQCADAIEILYLKPEWIKVNDRLPEYNINVLAISSKKDIRLTCVGSDGILDDYELEVDESDYWTHWMPLPQSPTL